MVRNIIETHHLVAPFMPFKSLHFMSSLLIFAMLFCALSSHIAWSQDPTQYYGRQFTIPRGVKLISPQNKKVTNAQTAQLKVLGHEWNGRKLIYVVSGGYRIEAKALDPYLPGCNMKLPTNTRNLRQVATALNNQLQSLDPRNSPNDSWNENCYNFITRSGKIGPWGQGVLNAIRTTGSSQCLYSTWLWQRLCPRFATFSQEKKDHFIAYFMATKAMDESSCNPNARAKAKNGYGVGFFMLEESQKLRAGRGRFCAGKPEITRQIPFQFQCAISQINNVQCGKGVRFGESGGYWQESNKMNGDISESIVRGYAGCN